MRRGLRKRQRTVRPAGAVHAGRAPRALTLPPASATIISVYCDAHLHLVDLDAREPGFWRSPLDFPWKGAVASHDPGEFAASEIIRASLPPTLAGFGIHPQAPGWENADFLASLAGEGKIDFIGEAGFDFFGDTPGRVRTEETMKRQGEVFEFQAGLAARHGLPLLIHSRKALDLLMSRARLLKKIPSVIFHCWPGRIDQAFEFMRKGIDCYFSFGTAILRDGRRLAESCAGIPGYRLLAETDAPWQPPHGEPWTRREDILRVVAKMASVRGIDEAAMERLLETNFRKAYNLKEIPE